ncbi:MAG: hypothetical protein JSR83_01085 [Proteobacteria bacterium]|nr:hypothetical protein [Pseudomonadota bacterium]
MQCDCITDLEKRLADHMKPQAGETASAKCLGSALFLGEKSLESGLNIAFRITGDKRGFTSEKGKEMPVKANYCPFCGKPTAKPETPAEAPAAS